METKPKPSRIIVDTREKPNAIRGILRYFDANGIEYVRHKLDVGDYMIEGRPDIVVDRKQTIDELAKNCTSDRARFKRELERAAASGTTVVLLVEQNRYKTSFGIVTVKHPVDLILWSGLYTCISGERVYNILMGWVKKYPLRVEFCRKSDTGKRIIEVLNDEK